MKIKFFNLDWLLVIIALLLLAAVCYVYREKEAGNLIRYNQEEKREVLEAEPASREFGLMIPELLINVPVAKEVESQDRETYFKALENGVAHYKGTDLPGEEGNIFIYGHSSFIDGAEGNYKEVFKYLDDLDEDDEIFIWYENKKIAYRVRDKKIVEPEDLSVLEDQDGETVTLMTCHPPGTKEKRLIVVAERK